MMMYGKIGLDEGGRYRLALCDFRRVLIESPKESPAAWAELEKCREERELGTR
jgi:hypothetical protein